MTAVTVTRNVCGADAFTPPLAVPPLSVSVTVTVAVPLALGAGDPGREIQQPMAVVILGGIVTSTFLNMIVIPALYLKYGEAAAQAPAHDLKDDRGLAPAGD